MTEPDAAKAAAIHEAELRHRADDIRGDATELSPDLFLKLWPLLLEPIPEAYIQRIGPVTGKPYESTGIRSVQVQIDRMNNVLTPLGWDDEVEYEDGGKLCLVHISVLGVGGEPLLTRSSRGGVDRGSTIGNVYKGSYTSAAKVAFARIGVGAAIYIGTTDFDPDVNPDVASQKGDEPTPVGPGIAKQIVDRAWVVESVRSRLQLIIVRLTNEDPGDVSTKEAANKVVAKLTAGEAQKLDEFVNEQAQKLSAEQTLEMPVTGGRIGGEPKA